MTQLKIGGVPEYFNLPIYQAIERGAFSERGIDLKLTDISEGTGAMSKMLSTGELDLAVILTEGIVKSITEGNPSKIIKNYVESPLIWGVHTPFSSAPTSITQLKEKKIAISRFGSGSHLMSFLLAKRMNWKNDEFDFHIINNLMGARESFKKEETNIFLWEKYTTQPYVDAQDFVRIDEVETPWPCFVIAANNQSLEEHSDLIKNVCQIINQECNLLLNNPDLKNIIAERFNLKPAATSEIVKRLKWSTKTEVNKDAINEVIETLTELNLIEKIKPVNELVW